MALSQDIHLNEEAFTTASDKMRALKTTTEDLKTKLEQMYRDLKGAMQTPTGEAISFTSQKVLLKPIEDMIIIIDHISDTLSDISEKGNYKDVFVDFEKLNEKIKFRTQ